ncbi:P-loop containing nucleoside triphosphate hydrolase protein [Lophium mytilinum]|uniref:P-loop containing nucleoside triphosphate hydrolase protein n=1 Tax=Lophium mytilinum TaxID=390894 RepID=A0A6A6QI87_9PEZI|nr:P-loop containing nucleoside triphosphate hydrolase protein [Lophium mytilinum]
MEATYRDLAATIQSRAAQSKKRRFLVAIAGAPGSGKTTIATETIRIINQTAAATSPSSTPTAIAVSMDGFHLSRSTLDALPNKEEAYIRRGAPWTFDVDALLAFVHNLRVWADRYPKTSTATPESTSTSTSTSESAPLAAESSPEAPLLVPSFDHAAKDPVVDGVTIPPSAEIVVLEGNYLLLNQDKWRDIAPLVDLRVFVDVDLDVARARVARRHVAAGIEKTLEDGFRRVDANDYINGIATRDSLVEWVDVRVRSVEE